MLGIYAISHYKLLRTGKGKEGKGVGGLNRVSLNLVPHFFSSGFDTNPAPVKSSAPAPLSYTKKKTITNVTTAIVQNNSETFEVLFSFKNSMQIQGP